MSKIFICYAPEDRGFALELSAHLRSIYSPNDVYGTWLRSIDPHLNGIEESDVFIFILSPASVSSMLCKQELMHALALNKPVVPILIDARTVIPKTIEHIQYINFSDGPTPSDYVRLFASIRDVSYRPEHKAKISSRKRLLLVLRDPVVQFVVATTALVLSLIPTFFSMTNEIPPVHFPTHAILFPSLTHDLNPLDPTATSTPTITPSPTQSATPSITPTPDLVLIADLPISIRFASGSEIGSGHMRVFHPIEIKAPASAHIELELVFDSYFVTPTPAGLRTVIPVTTPSGLSTIVLQQSPTPRELRYEGLADTVTFTELMGATLLCSASSFTNCDADRSDGIIYPINLKTVKWSWWIAPQKDVSGKQGLTLEIWRHAVSELDNLKVEPDWEYHFEIDVLPENQPLIPDDAETLAGHIVTILGALIVLVGTVWAAKAKLKKPETSEKNPTQPAAPATQTEPIPAKLAEQTTPRDQPSGKPQRQRGSRRK